MNILAIDTSNPVLGIALTNENNVIGELITNIPKDHSSRLMPAIEKLMNDVEMTAEDIDKVVVARGPGSYTGVRIGLTTAKTLAWVLNIPISSVSSIETLAYQGRLSSAVICPFFDARRGTVYTGLYKWNREQLDVVVGDQHILMEEWLIKLAENKNDVLFLSPNIDLYKDLIRQHLGDLAIIPESSYHIARPSHLALAGTDKAAENVHELVPSYLRLAEAEAKWLKAQKEQS